MSLKPAPTETGMGDDHYQTSLDQTRELDHIMGQVRQLAPLAEGLLARIGLHTGDAAIDLGCGPLGILDLLGARVGQTGRVVGVDLDAAMIDRAHQDAVRRRLPFELIIGDATSTGLSGSSFDLVHARRLLTSVANSNAVVAEMVNLARPGGAVALQELDLDSVWCDPPDPKWDRLQQLLTTAYNASGRDMRLGRSLERRLRNAGLPDVHSAAHVVRTVPGNPWHTNLPRLAIAERSLILDAGACTSEELDQLVTAAHRHLHDPESTTAIVLWQAWARKPGLCDQRS